MYADTASHQDAVMLFKKSPIKEGVMGAEMRHRPIHASSTERPSKITNWRNGDSIKTVFANGWSSGVADFG